MGPKARSTSALPDAISPFLSYAEGVSVSMSLSSDGAPSSRSHPMDWLPALALVPPHHCRAVQWALVLILAWSTSWLPRHILEPASSLWYWSRLLARPFYHFYVCSIYSIKIWVNRTSESIVDNYFNQVAKNFYSTSPAFLGWNTQLLVCA